MEINDVQVTPEERNEYLKDLSVHIMNQQKFTARIMQAISAQSQNHDADKLKNPLFTFYMKLAKALKPVKYGSDEYKKIISNPMVAEHQRNNTHHPECFENGINGMTLMDIVNMLADWKSASLRSDTPFLEGMKKNKERFKISDQLYQVLENTVIELGWDKTDDTTIEFEWEKEDET